MYYYLKKNETKMEITNEKYNYYLEQIKKFIPSEDAGDVLQEILLQVLENSSGIDDIDAYIVSSAYRSYYSKTSPYARKYKAPVCMDEFVELNRICEIIEDEPTDELNLIDMDIVREIDSFTGACWWEKEVVKRKILEEKTFNELSIEYNISESQVQYSYYKTLKKLNKYISKKYGKEN